MTPITYRLRNRQVPTIADRPATRAAVLVVVVVIGHDGCDVGARRGPHGRLRRPLEPGRYGAGRQSLRGLARSPVNSWPILLFPFRYYPPTSHFPNLHREGVAWWVRGNRDRRVDEGDEGGAGPATGYGDTRSARLGSVKGVGRPPQKVKRCGGRDTHTHWIRVQQQ